MLLTFLLGIAFYMVGVPIVEQIVSLICVAIECAKIKFTEKLAESQAKLEKLNEENNVISYPIGFQIPTEEESIDEDE